MTTRRRFLKTSAAAAVAGGLLPYAGRAPAAVNNGGTLTVALFADPRTFDPHLAGNLQGRATTQSVHDTLFELDAAGKLAPGLVEAWEWKDSLTIVLTTRSGVKFHDDTEFNAEAVRYNLERIRNPDTGSIRGGEISALDTVEVLDAKTVRLRLKQPFAAFLYPLVDVAGCVVSPTAAERWGKEYGLHPAGTGPFKLVEYLKDAHSILERNGDYWIPGKPHLDRLVLRPIPVDSTRLAELRSGGVQFAESLPLQDIQRLRAGNEVVVSEKVGFRWEWFGFNVREEYPGHSKKLRQAFQYAIDREALHHVAYNGTGSIGYDGILPGSPFHDPKYKPYERNLDMAKRLVDESGLDQPIEILAPLTPDPVKQRAAQIFQANAAEIGVTVKTEGIAARGYWAAMRKGTMQLILEGWWGYRPDPDQYLYIMLHSSGKQAKRMGYNNPKMDELMTAQRSVVDLGERRKLFRQISMLMNEDAVYVPYHYGSDFKGHLPNVKGFVHTQDSIISYRDLYLEG
jgi:peptide/nickel transport system substrate-binding protein